MAANSYFWAIEQAKETIAAARIDETDILPTIQPLYMNPESREDLAVIQMKPEMVRDLSEGQVFTIRGEPNEPAVLCSKTQTFQIKETETSNLLMVVPELLFPKNCCKLGSSVEGSVFAQEITKVFNKYYELNPCRPKLKKLKELLNNCLYRGKIYEEENLGDKYTLKDLHHYIQASEEELNLELENIHAFEIDGYVRALDFDYEFHVVSHICDTVCSESLPLNRVPRGYVIGLLEDLEPRLILERCFYWYTEDNGMSGDDGDRLYALKVDAVCRLYAEVLLRATGKFDLEEFLESWQKCVPEGMITKLAQLEGIAITDFVSKREALMYFPVHDLPENINERLSKLFKTKPKWTFEEIVPYIRGLTLENMDEKALLTKYTRSSTNNGVKMYSSKW